MLHYNCRCELTPIEPESPSIIVQEKCDGCGKWVSFLKIVEKDYIIYHTPLDDMSHYCPNYRDYDDDYEED